MVVVNQDGVYICIPSPVIRYWWQSDISRCITPSCLPSSPPSTPIREPLRGSACLSAPPHYVVQNFPLPLPPHHQFLLFVFSVFSGLSQLCPVKWCSFCWSAGILCSLLCGVLSSPAERWEREILQLIIIWPASACKGPEYKTSRWQATNWAGS